LSSRRASGLWREIRAREAIELRIGFHRSHRVDDRDRGRLRIRVFSGPVTLSRDAERYLERRPMVFTTNKAVAAWGLVLHDPDLAEAIIDRVLEHGRLVELPAASHRTPHIKRVEPDRSPGQPPAGISGNHRRDIPEPTPTKRSVCPSHSEGKVVERVASRKT
jgi:hypothetical protein